MATAGVKGLTLYCHKQELVHHNLRPVHTVPPIFHHSASLGGNIDCHCHGQNYIKISASFVQNFTFSQEFNLFFFAFHNPQEEL